MPEKEAWKKKRSQAKFFSVCAFFVEFNTPGLASVIQRAKYTAATNIRTSWRVFVPTAQDDMAVTYKKWIKQKGKKETEMQLGFSFTIRSTDPFCTYKDKNKTKKKE